MQLRKQYNKHINTPTSMLDKLLAKIAEVRQARRLDAEGTESQWLE